MTPARVRVRPRNQGGFVGGADGVLFGLLLMVAGSLAVLNIWSMIDTRAALDAAAREYMRSYTEASTPQEARSAGEQAAFDVLLRRGSPLSGVRITAPDAGRFGPCSPAAVTIEAEAPAARLPFLDDLGARRLRVSHREIVDPHREMTSGPTYDPHATPCGD